MNEYLPGFDVDGIWMPRSAPVDWEAAFRHYSPAVRAYVRQRVPAAAVDDAVQDTFERAYRSRHRFDPTRPMWPWLATIAGRACIEAQRRRTHETVGEVRPDQVVALDDPHVDYERRQQEVAISYTLASLTPRHRRLLVRWEVEGWGYDELAAEEGLTRQALKSVLCRARHGFRAGYKAVAERAGLAAFACWRQLDRLRRSSVLAPGTELAFGSVMIGVAAATLLAAVPAVQAQSEAKVAAVRPADTLASVPPPEGPVEDRGAPGRPPTPSADAPNPGPGPGEHSGLPHADGGAAVKMTPTGPQATLGIDWEKEGGGGRVKASLTIDCDDGVSDIACAVIRAVPQQ